MNASHSISIVIPAYNEEGNITELHSELVTTLKNENLIEIIFVDDGSFDSTWDVINILHDKDPRVKGLRFSRNFGHQYALLAGLNSAIGAAVITMDADLQHPPHVIPDLIQKWEKGYRIVKTSRVDNRKTTFFKRNTSKIFYNLFSWLSGVDLSNGMADFRLLDRQVVEQIIQNKEASLFLRGLIEWVGFKSYTLEYRSRERFSGSTKYSLNKMLKFAWTGITSFSIIPLRLGIILGVFSGSFSFLILVHAMYIKLFTDEAVAGWASIISVLCLLFCFLFILLGIMGEYIGRILIQVQQRERFIISERIG